MSSVCEWHGTQLTGSCRELHHCALFPLACDRPLLTFPQRGPPDSPFAGGEYHGVLLFPSEYPFKPPGIKVRGHSSGWTILLTAVRWQMLTPSGRFQPDRKICFSMSDFHPGTVRFLCFCV